MKLATIRTDQGTRAVRLDADHAVDLGAANLGEFLGRPDWHEAAAAAGAAWASTTYRLDRHGFATLVPNPSKVFCVGLNYKNHILETGNDLPAYPMLFTKFADALIGAHDDIARPAETEQFDWEVELAIVIGRPVRRADEAAAEAAIAGFTVLNDISCRDWQMRTREWTQGKTWDSCTPVGPVMVTPDDLPGGVRPALAVRTTVDGEVMQDDTTADLLFDPVALVRYISTIIRLNPGDLIATGTPGGVGHARRPAVYLQPGQTVECSIEGIGATRNLVVQG